MVISAYTQNFYDIRSMLEETGMTERQATDLICEKFYLIREEMNRGNMDVTNVTLQLLGVEGLEILSNIPFEERAPKANLVVLEYLRLKENAFKEHLDHIVQNCTKERSRKARKKRNNSPRLWQIIPMTCTDMYGRTYTGNYRR